VLLELDRLIVPPGHQLQLRDVSWAELEQIVEELSDRAARISYSDGFLEVMTPLPAHEDAKNIISNLVEALLEECDREFRNLGSTTFKNEAMLQAVEADECFYIQNEAAIRGKERVDLAVDPPPDLALEIDITNRTRLNNYEQLGIPELWRYDGTTLEIYVLIDRRHTRAEQSRQFPDFPTIAPAIPEYLERSKQQGRNATMRQFRRWVAQQLAR